MTLEKLLVFIVNDFFGFRNKRMSVIEKELADLKIKIPLIDEVELNACVPAIVNVKIT